MTQRCVFCTPSYEVLFAPQPPATSCQFLSGCELALQHQAAEANSRVMRQAERLKAEGTTTHTCEEQLQEIERCIAVFQRENTDQGSFSLAAIITSALCALMRCVCVCVLSDPPPQWKAVLSYLCLAKAFNSSLLYALPFAVIFPV